MSKSDRPIHIAIAVLLFFFITLITPEFRGFEADIDSWKYWAEYISEFGLPNAYGSKTNYPPLYQYILWIFGKLAGSTEAIGKYISYLRVFTLAADYWALWLVYRWIDRKVDYLYLLLCSLLNIAYIYNTLIFGQVDAIFAAFAFAAFYYLEKGNRIASAVLIVLALNMKLQAVIFIPLWGLLLLGSMHKNRRWKDLAYIIPAILLTQVLLLLPFYFGKDGLLPVWNAVAGLADTYPVTSLNAFNMWFWIIPGTDASKDDVRSLFGLTYYQIGLISFCLASFITLWPVLRHTIRTLVTRSTPALTKEVVWLSGALITLVFFFFSTRMHERYSHGAFIFLTAYAFYHRKFGLYALFSLAYLLNLDKVLRGLKLDSYHTLIFDARFIAALFALCIVWAGYLLYRTQYRAPGKSAAAELPGTAADLT